MPALSALPAPRSHGPLEPVFQAVGSTRGTDVFQVRGTVSPSLGVTITRNMTVVRSGRELTVISAVRLDDKTEAELLKLGEVKHLVKLGHFHGMDDAYYAERFKPTIWAEPRASHARGLRTGRGLQEGEPGPIPDATFFSFRNAREAEGAFCLDRAGGILIACDSVQNWGDYAGCSRIARFLMPRIGFHSEPLIGPRWKKSMALPDGPPLLDDFRRLVELPFKHVLGAHGSPIEDRGPDAVRKALRDAYGAEAKV